MINKNNKQNNKKFKFLFNRLNTIIKRYFIKPNEFNKESLEPNNLYIYRKDFSPQQLEMHYKFREKETEEIYKRKNNFCIINNINSISSKFYKDNIEQFNWYLSGLFTGDGYVEIYFDKTAKKNYPKIEIKFHTKEVTSAFWLCEVFNNEFQTPKPVKHNNCWTLRSSKNKLIKDLFIRMNGKIFLPTKIEQMKKLSKCFNIPFIECDTKNIDFTENAFLSGFFDAEGFWSRNKVNGEFRHIVWGVGQKDKDILRIIQNSFSRKISKTVGSIMDNFEKQTNGEMSYIATRWHIRSYREDMDLMLNYLERFPLKAPLKALGVKRYRLLKEHYKYKTFSYKEKDLKIYNLFCKFIENFTTPLKDNETEESFLEKYKVPDEIKTLI